MIEFNCTISKNATLPIRSTNNIGDFPAGLKPAGKLTLSGALVDTDGTVNFDKNNFSSSLSITTPGGNNLAGVVFTVIGYNNGIYVTETINGPNGNTVNTNNLFTKIVQVSISILVNAPFSLGSAREVAVRLVIPSNIGTYSSNIAYFALRSKDVGAGGWSNNDTMVYANLATENNLLLSSNLQYATASNNYFLLAGGSAAISQGNLQKGVTANISVVASELVFFIAGGASRNSASIVELGFRLV